MVRCQEFYEQFEKKGNFCNKSGSVVKKVEEYMDYMKRNKFNDFSISNCAIEPFIRIEELKDGVVHEKAIKKLRKKIKHLGGEGITRRISIEIINQVNIVVKSQFRLDSIPDIRNKIGNYEHNIDGVSHEVREQFNILKKKYGFKDNNSVLLEMLHWTDKCMSEHKEWIENGNKKDTLSIVSTK